MVLDDLSQQDDLNNRREKLKKLAVLSKDDDHGDVVEDPETRKTSDEIKYVDMPLKDAIRDILKTSQTSLTTEKIARKLTDGGYPKSPSVQTIHTCFGRNKGLAIKVGEGQWVRIIANKNEELI